MPHDLALLIKSATDELILSPVTYGEQATLAGRLAIPWGEVQEFVTPRRGTETRRYVAERERKIKDVVESSLEMVFSAGSSKLEWPQVERLAKRRIYFETIMAWSIGAMPDRAARLGDKVASIQDQLRELSQSQNLTSQAAESAWRLDGDFHRQICQISGYDHVAQVVDRVIEACPRWGLPDQPSDIVGTWREHEEMIEAITARRVDRERVYNAIHRHVSQAMDRWRAKDLRMKPTEGVQRWQQQAAAWLTARNQPIVADGEAAFLRDLPSLLGSHRNKWVAYHGDNRLGFGSDKVQLWKLFERQGHPVREVVVRKVTPRIEAGLEASYL